MRSFSAMITLLVIFGCGEATDQVQQIGGEPPPTENTGTVDFSREERLRLKIDQVLSNFGPLERNPLYESLFFMGLGEYEYREGDIRYRATEVVELATEGALGFEADLLRDTFLVERDLQYGSYRIYYMNRMVDYADRFGSGMGMDFNCMVVERTENSITIEKTIWLSRPTEESTSPGSWETVADVRYRIRYILEK